MSEDSEAHREKNEGSQAWSRGEYQKATDHFSNAINLGGNKEFLKVLYSNRSAAFLKLNRADLALNDGNKCVELDSAWAKGYARKGDALYSQKKFTDAYNAYNSGLRIAPNDSTFTQKAEQAMRAIRTEAERQQQWSNSSSSGFGSSNTSTAPATAASGGILRYLELSIFLFALLYMIPLGRFINVWSYKLCAAVFAGLNMQKLYQKYGFPQFSTEYGARVLPDPSSMRAFIGFYLIFAPNQYMFTILPLVLIQVSAFLPEIFAYARTNAEQIQNSVSPMLAQYVPQLRSMNVAQLFNSQNMSPINTQILKFAATIEVYQGIFHIVELLLPSRSMIQLYLWWQYLRMRYMLDQSGHMKSAFYELDARISQLLFHPYCPQIIRQGYTIAKGYMAKQVEMPTAESAANASSGSFLSKCTIM